MSYDLRLINKKTKSVISINDKKCDIKYYGGTIAVDENLQPLPINHFEFNITYNYAPFFYNFLHKDDGLRYLYDKPIDLVITILNNAIGNIIDKFKSTLYKEAYKFNNDKHEYEEIPIDERKINPTYMDDYWKCTPSNAIKSLIHIIDCLNWVTSNYTKDEYSDFVLEGD